MTLILTFLKKRALELEPSFTVQNASKVSCAPDGKKILGARTLPRALRARIFWWLTPKYRKNHDFFGFWGIECARTSARTLYFFIQMYSPSREDVFNTLDDHKISKIDNYNSSWKSAILAKKWKNAKKNAKFWKISFSFLVSVFDRYSWWTSIYKQNFLNWNMKSLSN